MANRDALPTGTCVATWDDEAAMSIEHRTVVIPPTSGEAPDQDTRPPRAGQPVLAGRYHLGRRIGKGGMGEGIAARDEQVGRDAAIKRMRAAAPGERAGRRVLRGGAVHGPPPHPPDLP